MNGRDASDYHKSLTGCASDDERYPTVSAHSEEALFLTQLFCLGFRRMTFLFFRIVALLEFPEEGICSSRSMYFLPLKKNRPFLRKVLSFFHGKRFPCHALINMLK